MLASFHFAFQSGSLSISQRRGVISLIPKKNKDKSILENLRPISLLNVDYKILTKAIAKRIEKTLPNIINLDQTGYVKGRYIGENIRLIQVVMFLTKRLNTPGIAIFLDFRKAFDTIKWNYLLSTLRLFKFGPDIQRWMFSPLCRVRSTFLRRARSPFPNSGLVIEPTLYTSSTTNLGLAMLTSLSLGQYAKVSVWDFSEDFTLR